MKFIRLSQDRVTLGVALSARFLVFVMRIDWSKTPKAWIATIKQHMQQPIKADLWGNNSYNDYCKSQFLVALN